LIEVLRIRPPYHRRPTIGRLNCMQFGGPIAQIESGEFGGFSRCR
jgi:hypothetical protein